MVNKIIELIKNQYLYFEKLDNLTKQRIINLNKESDYNIFIKKLSNLIANEFDPHSKVIDLNSKNYYLPIFLTILNEKIITVEDNFEFNINKGSSLLKINDIDINDFINKDYIDRFRISKIVIMMKIMEKIAVSKSRNRIKLKFKNNEQTKTTYLEYKELNEISKNQNKKYQSETFEEYKNINGVSYFKIFNLLNESHMKKMISNIKKSINKSPIVLDIRNNMGGRIDLAINLSELFSTNNSYIYTKSRYSMHKQIIKASLKELKFPIAILCNNLTGSALEYVFLKSLFGTNNIYIYGNKTAGFKDIATVYNIDKSHRLILTTKSYTNDKGQPLRKKHFYPQINVPTEIDDYSVFPDKQLEKVIKHMKGM